MSARVGILGGTFDPPHRAHVVMVRAAAATLGLEKVLWMPAPSPPHKRRGEISAFEHRFRMSELAVEGEAVTEVSAFERGRKGPSYTADMLEAYRAQTGDDVYFIVGADSVRDMPQWRDPRRILDNCTVVVFPRTGVDTILDVPGEASLVVFESPVVDVSSTMVRERVARGEPVGEYVPDAVRKYIEAQSLYR